MPEKIGSDVLGGGSEPRMSPKKRKELEQKFREEQAKKRAEDKKRVEEMLIEELPVEGIPGAVPHEATPEERAEIIAKEQEKKKKKSVHVREHYRSPPNQEVVEIFELR